MCIWSYSCANLCLMSNKLLFNVIFITIYFFTLDNIKNWNCTNDANDGCNAYVSCCCSGRPLFLFVARQCTHSVILIKWHKLFGISNLLVVPEHRIPEAKNATHNKNWVQSNPVLERAHINGVSILSGSCYFSQKYTFFWTKY